MTKMKGKNCMHKTATSFDTVGHLLFISLA